MLVAFTPVIFFGWEIDNPVAAIAGRARSASLLWLLLPAPLQRPRVALRRLRARHARPEHGRAARARRGPASDASARILAAADDERRRIERDLHDGAQQRLVALNVLLGVVETKLEKDPAAAAPLVARAREEATEAVKELRELARGIHPALLADRGLIAALEALAARAPFKVEISGVPEHRLPPAVEATAYFITAEALTNVAKYAGDEATAYGRAARGPRPPARDGPRRRRRRRRPAARHRPARPQRPRRGARRPLRGHLARPAAAPTVIAELPLERP